MNTSRSALAHLSTCGIALVLAAWFAAPLQAHCDSLEGPVVVEARAALAAGDPTSVLKWVRAEDEAAVRAAFTETLAARALGAAASAVADRWFFETLVRLHRAGEGAAFTGLLPAGAPLEPGIAEAEAALAGGSASELAHHLAAAIERGLAERLARTLAAKRRAGESVALGRAYVAAYVDYVHYAKALAEAAQGGTAHTEAAAAHAH